MARDRIRSLRNADLEEISLEELEHRLEMQRLPASEEDYCNLNVCTGDCAEGVWCAGGFCGCDGELCFCHGDCSTYCHDYCQDGGGW